MLGGLATIKHDNNISTKHITRKMISNSGSVHRLEEAHLGTSVTEK
jgi:hypothetical protein